MKKTGFRRAFALLVLLLVASIASPGFNCKPGTGEGTEDTVVARVNDRTITKAELSERTRLYRVFMALRSVPQFARFLMETDQGKAALDMYRNYVLDIMIEEKLIIQKAEARGINITEAEINSRLETIINETKEVSNREELLERLQKDRRNLHDLKEEIYRKLIREKLKEMVTKDVTIKADEVASYYEKNRDSFRGKDGEVKPLSRVRDHVRERLKEDRREEFWRKWLEKTKERADIRKELE